MCSFKQLGWNGSATRRERFDGAEPQFVAGERELEMVESGGGGALSMPMYRWETTV